jgi:hypothetical protein
MDAVKAALAHLGNEARPLDIQSFVKTKYNISMTADHISNYKGEILRRAKATAKPAAAKKPAATKKPASPKAASPKAAAPKAAALKPAAKPSAHKPAVAKAAAHKPAPAAKGPASVSGVSLPDIKTVKDLVHRVGANELRTLIDLLSK